MAAHLDGADPAAPGEESRGREPASDVPRTATGVPLGRVNSAPNADNVWRALFELWELLRAQVNSEATYQAYFERNPVVFQVLGYDAHASFEQSSGRALAFDPERNFRPEPDFLCATWSSGTLTIFELKTPFVGELITARPTDGNRAKLREHIARHVVQAKEYVASIQGSQETRGIVRDALGLERIAEYQVTLVCGFAEENDSAQVTQVLTGTVPPIRVLYFDEIIELLAEEYDRQYRGARSRPGWCGVYHLGFSQAPDMNRAYVCDGGARDRDRISLIREGDELSFECIDSNGRGHRLSAHITPGVHYVIFEFSTDESGTYLSFRVDDEQEGLILGRTQFQCDPDMSNYVFGADLDGGNGAAFDMHQTLFVNRTLSLEEKLGMYGYSLEKLGSAKGCLHFDVPSFMHSVPEGALIQEQEALKPLLIPQGIRIGRINSKVPANAPRPRFSEGA